MSQVAAELGISATGLSLNHSWVRQLAGQNSGPVSMSSLQGQSAQYNGPATIQGGPSYFVNLNVPFFRGVIAQGTQDTSNNLALSFSTAPNWSGNIFMKNVNNGATAILTKQNSTTWSLYGAGAVLIPTGGSNITLQISPN